MNCQEYELRLAALADAPDPNPAELEQHLVDCAACRALAVELEANLGGLSALRESPSPADAALPRWLRPEPVAKQVTELSRPPRAVPMAWKYGSAAAALLVLGSGLWLLREGGSIDDPKMEVTVTTSNTRVMEQVIEPLPSALPTRLEPRLAPRAPKTLPPRSAPIVVDIEQVRVRPLSRETVAAVAETPLLPEIRPLEQPAPLEERPEDRILVKLVTPDPDVVIYWLAPDGAAGF